MASSRFSKQVILVFLLSFSLLLCASFAATGGRMGGSSFSKSRKSSSSSSSSFRSSYSSYNHYQRHQYNRYSYSNGGRAYYSKSSPYYYSGALSPGELIMICCFFFGFVVLIVIYFHDKEDRTSLVMVQVGLRGSASSVQKKLNDVAKTTDTSTSDGWKIILNETTSALLRHQDYIIFGYSSVKEHKSVESLERNFIDISKEERDKTETETLSNVNNIRSQTQVPRKTSKPSKNYIVVTILVAAKGSLKVSATKSIDHLKCVLQSLNLSAEKLIGVEVLWSPQDENDTLTDEELLEDYPLLRPI